ncbi:MAG: LUD domain-containing protein [Candidatus Doudnabacteria bacterium]|nr:LUD domain-containing protein [Candidatus Doudnabacteria bacterium]
MKPFSALASQDSIDKAVQALKQNGIEAFVAENGEQAKKKVYELVPEGNEVMVMTSETLRTLGLEKEINESGKFELVKAKLAKMDESQARQKKKLGAAATYSIGSVHAVTEDGKALVASNTGSQLPGYAYGSDKVVWVVGAQKLVKDLDEGIRRIYEYVLPLETKRARLAYGLPETWNSNVSKLLLFNKEITADRIKMVIVKEAVGF